MCVHAAKFIKMYASYWIVHPVSAWLKSHGDCNELSLQDSPERPYLRLIPFLLGSNSHFSQNAWARRGSFQFLMRTVGCGMKQENGKISSRDILRAQKS